MRRVRDAKGNQPSQVNRADPNARYSYEGQKKADLEVTLDEFLSENADKFADEPKVAPYFNSRARAAGSPTKKDAAKLDVKEGLKVVKRRATRTAAEIVGVE